MVTYNQYERLSICECAGLQDYSSRNMASQGIVPSVGLRPDYYEDMVYGDSGSPRFLLLGNIPALICTLHYGGAGAGCFVTHFKSEIQFAMDSLCSGYELQEIDFSSFTTIDGDE